MRTRVGYAGGGTDNPTYYNLSDHSETIQIDYDPAVISYEDLLEVFFTGHSCTTQSRSRQYASIIFHHDEQQRDLALAAKERYEQQLDRTIVTEIVPFDAFYLAEDYHQKYYLQNVRLIWADLSIIYPDMSGIINSTAAARMNGFVGGNGNLADLEEQIDSFGLSEVAADVLLHKVRQIDRMLTR